MDENLTQASSTETNNEPDPFAPENVGAFTLVTLMRLYDVNMALLNEQNPQVAARLHERHEQGRIIGSFPWINPDVE